jgi:hypothetical protein
MTILNHYSEIKRLEEILEEQRQREKYVREQIDAIEAKLALLRRKDHTERILAKVAQERERQDAQWGGPPHDDKHPANDWADFIIQRIERALVQRRLSNDAGVYRLLLHATALCVAWMEAIDREHGGTGGNWTQREEGKTHGKGD